jgi:hypothetical protein
MYAPIFLADIPAMTELLENIMYLTHEAGEGAAFLGTLDRLREAVPGSRWNDQICYLRALSILYPDWSEQAEARARVELKDVAVEQIDDLDFLQTHYTLFAETLGLSEQLRYLERLIRESRDPGHKLQYAAGRAMLLALHNDTTGAREELAKALRTYEGSDGAKSGYGLLMYAHALVDAGRMGVEEVEHPFDKADETFRAVAGRGELNSAGLADVEFSRGLAFATAGKWANALEAHQRAQALAFSTRTAIFLAEALAHLNRTPEAKAILCSLDYDSLSQGLKYDFCLSFALSLGPDAPSEDIRLLSERLKELKSPYPLFMERLRRVGEQIQELQRSELEAEIDKLRSQLANVRAVNSDDAIRSALSMHRNLPPRRQTMTLPLEEDLPHFLAKIVVHVCSQLLDQRKLLSTEPQSQEDTYTAYLTSLLQQRVVEYGWSVSDQKLGGVPSKNSPERGRRDLAFWKGGDVPFGIMEALRCSNMGATGAASLDEHLTRLVSRYDQCGSAVPLIVVYAELVDFEAFCAKYAEHLGSVQLTEAPIKSGPSVMQRWQSDGLLRRSLKMLATTHQVATDEVTVTHVLLHLPPR